MEVVTWFPLDLWTVESNGPYLRFDSVSHRGLQKEPRTASLLLEGRLSGT